MADDDHENCFDTMEYWLHSLSAKVPESNIILVGTHYDIIIKKKKKLFQLILFYPNLNK